MYLYCRNNSNVDVYEIRPIIDKMTSYKQSLIKTVSKENLFYYVLTNESSVANSLFEEKKLHLNQINFSDSYGLNMGTHSTLFNYYQYKDPEQYVQEELDGIIKSYIAGNYRNHSTCKIVDLDNYKNMYFLMTEQNPERDWNCYRVNNMLSLPKELYLLQLLENGCYDMLLSEDINNQLQNFNIVKITSISNEVISNLFRYNMVSNKTYHEINDKVETTNKILAKAKIHQ